MRREKLQGPSCDAVTYLARGLYSNLTLLRSRCPRNAAGLFERASRPTVYYWDQAIFASHRKLMPRQMAPYLIHLINLINEGRCKIYIVWIQVQGRLEQRTRLCGPDIDLLTCCAA